MNPQLVPENFRALALAIHVDHNLVLWVPKGDYRSIGLNDFAISFIDYNKGEADFI